MAETGSTQGPPAESVAEAEFTDTDTTGKGLPRVLDRRILLAIVLAATAAVYLNSLSGKFLYDDWYQIERNESIKSWTNAPKLLTQHVWQFVEAQRIEVSGVYYRPFFNIALLLNYQLFGLNETGWHLTSLLLHLFATALVFFLAREWSVPNPAALAAALIFGVHPVHVEAIAWASALPDVMVAVFALSSILFYEKARNADQVTLLWLFSIAFAFLAVGSKETGILLPIFFLIREFISRDEATDVKAVGVRLLPYFVLAGIYLLIRFVVMGYILSPEPSTQHVSLMQALLSVPPALVEYFRLLVFPFSLSVIYDFTFVSSAAEPRVLIGIALLATAVATLYFLKPRNKAVYFCVLLFFLFLLPALNLKSLRPFESLIHDRYLYLSSAGFCIIVALIINHLARGSNAVLAALAVAIAVPLSIVTVAQNRTWRDDTSMTENAVRYAPSNAFMRLHLGEVYEDNNRLDEAEREFRAAIDLQPRYAASHLAFANFLSRRGRRDEAEALFEQAIALGSDLGPTWMSRGGNFLDRGELPQAEAAFKEALRINPGDAVAHLNLGVTFERAGQPAMAEAEYKKSIEFAPDLYEAYSALASLLVGQNRIEEAVASINIVRASKPDNIPILYPLGAVYLKQRQCGQAVDVLRRFSDANPSHDRAVLLLGFGYECIGDKPRAAEAFTRAINAAPNAPTADVARRRLEQLK